MKYYLLEYDRFVNIRTCREMDDTPLAKLIEVISFNVHEFRPSEQNGI